jgi:hypothetical protein
MQAFNMKKAAESKHRFYTAEMKSPRHWELEKQIVKLNDTKDLVSEMPKRPNLTEVQFQKHLKHEVYNPKPTIFPSRESAANSSASKMKENQTPAAPSTTKAKSAVSWSGYQPKHREWLCQPESAFQRGGTRKQQHFAYETSANIVGKKDQGQKEDVGQRLGNRFTNGFNMHRFHETGLYTQVEHEKVHARAKYPY